MKLTNKIIVVIASLIVVITAITSIIVLANIEIAVTPRIEGHIERELQYHSFSEIIISRGIRVNLTQSDSFSVRVKGADNFLNNYLNIEQKGEKLYFIIKPGIKHYSLYATVDISMPNLSKIVIEESDFEYNAFGTAIILSNFELEKLDANLSVDGTLVSVNSEIDNLKIKCSKFASVIFDSCKIKNINYYLEEYSYARFNNVSGNIKGKLNDNSILSFSRSEGEPEVLRSKKLNEIIKIEKETFTGLTLGSTMEEVEQIVKSNFGSKISEEYYFKKYKYNNLFPLILNLNFIGGSYQGIKIEEINLRFYRNSLQGVTMFLDSDSSFIERNYNTLLQILKRKYPHSQFSDSDHRTIWKAINDINEVETICGIYHDKNLIFYIYSEKLRNMERSEFEAKRNKYNSVGNFGKRQNELSENSIKSLLYYGLRN